MYEIKSNKIFFRATYATSVEILFFKYIPDIIQINIQKLVIIVTIITNGSHVSTNARKL